MPNKFKVELSANAESIVRRMQSMPARVVAAIAKGMDQANLVAVGNIQRNHLTGVGPFPPEQHKLGVRTTRLLGSARASRAQQIGDGQVQSAIGSNVIYALIHEFGGRIKIPARQQKVRLRTDARGNLVRQLANSNLAMFARKDHKRAKESVVTVGAHEVEMPERAPFRTGLEESRPNYKQSISRAVIAEMWKTQ